MDNTIFNFHHQMDYENIVSVLSETIIDIYRENPKVAFVCVGSDISTYDVAGPYIGTKLIEKPTLPFTVLGSLDDLVNANNIETTLAFIKENLEGYSIIAIDAAVTHNREYIGYINMEHNPCYPSSGLNNDLPPIGDYVINIINADPDVALFKNSYTRFSLTYNMCECVIKAITKAGNLLDGSPAYKNFITILDGLNQDQ